MTWTYDGVGNRTSEVLGSTTNTYNYPSTSNTLSSVTRGSTTVRAFSYDGAGNVTADTRSGTAYNYSYNNRGRLAELAIGSTVTADYTYDGVERMAIRTTQNMTPAGTTHYVYDTAGHLLMEATGTGTFLTEYVWLDDLPLAVVTDLDTSSPNLYFVHADQLDRPLRMTDGSESVVWDAIYRPFGDVQSITGSATNNLRFPGQYFLLEDGLHYNWYRHYDPTIGRYTQPDPLEFVNGPSLNLYAGGSPLIVIDPYGLYSIDDFMNDTGNLLAGSGSYFRGIYRFGRWTTRSTGLFGKCEQLKTQIEYVIATTLLNELARNPEFRFLTSKMVLQYVENNIPYFFGRVITGLTIAHYSPGIVGPALSLAAVAGDFTYTVENGVSGAEAIAQALVGMTGRQLEIYCECH